METGVGFKWVTSTQGGHVLTPVRADLHKNYWTGFNETSQDGTWVKNLWNFGVNPSLGQVQIIFEFAGNNKWWHYGEKNKAYLGNLYLWVYATWCGVQSREGLVGVGAGVHFISVGK